MKSTHSVNFRNGLLAPDIGRISSYFRAQRYRLLVEKLPDIEQRRVLDLGGSYSNWLNFPIHPKKVTTVNIDPQEHDIDWIEHIQADACELPSSIKEHRFDLVFSNSLIEHVGGAERRKKLAQEIQECAPHHWIQTPARSFPVEPHWIFPAFQFLPLKLRARVSLAWPFGHIRTIGGWRDAVEDALSVELLSATEMRYLFPESELIYERVLGVTKSFVAFR